MSRAIIIIKNCAAGLINQGFGLLLQLILRIVLLNYIGIELLGITAALSSVLSALSLAELGFQAAIVFHLYEPLVNKDIVTINKIMNILRCVYYGIGIMILGMAGICIPILPYVLKGIEVNGLIISLFLIMTANIAFSYFLSYKRALIYADQKEYIAKSVDTVVSIIFFVLKISAVIYGYSYIIVLLLQVIQTIIANYVINIICIKKYSYLKKDSFDSCLFKKIWGSVKNVFAGKFAGYIYGATDNVLISGMVSTVAVGYFTNYTTITIALKNAVSAIFIAMTPIVGNMLIINGNSEEQEKAFLGYTHFRYFMASVIIIPWILFSDKLIGVLFGKQYVMSTTVSMLLATDLYIHIVYSSCCEYINGAGIFNIDKHISIIGAGLNIVSSIICCRYFGVEGVLIGTVLSQMLLWGLRGYAVYKYVLQRTSGFLKYLIYNSKWLCLTLFTLTILSVIKDKIVWKDNILFLAVGTLISELIYIFLYFSVFGKRIILKYLIKKE